jgi:hypothetical protein
MMKLRYSGCALALLLAGCGSAAEPEDGPSPSTTTISYTGAPAGYASAGSSASLSVVRFTNEGAVATPLEVAPRAAWRALHDAYAALGIPVETDSATLRARSGRVAVSRQLAGQPLSALLNCGFTPLGRAIADEYRVSLDLVSVVRPRERASQVETRLSASAQQPSTGSSVECSSTGALELRLNQEVKVRAGAR